jgi:hypothetical protein
MQFELRLTDSEAGPSRRLTSLHLMLAFVLCGIGVNGLVLYWFRAQLQHFPQDYQPFALFGIVSFLAGLAIFGMFLFNRRWLMKGRRSLMLRIAEIALLLVSCVLFFQIGQRVPGFVFGVMTALVSAAAVWEFMLPKAQIILINETGIRIPKGGLSKSYNWVNIERVILRHGILSIELDGNKLLQCPVIPAGVDVAALEAFCLEQSAKQAEGRAANAAW